METRLIYKCQTENHYASRMILMQTHEQDAAVMAVFCV